MGYYEPKGFVFTLKDNFGRILDTKGQKLTTSLHRGPERQ